MKVGVGAERTVGAFAVGGAGAAVVAIAVGSIPACVDTALWRGRRGRRQGRAWRQVRLRLLADVCEWAGSAVAVALEHAPPPVLPAEVHVIVAPIGDVLEHCGKA